MKKTMVNAFITQHIGNRNDKICRRIWEDEHGTLFVKVNSTWIELSYYMRDKRYSVHIG